MKGRGPDPLGWNSMDLSTSRWSNIERRDLGSFHLWNSLTPSGVTSKDVTLHQDFSAVAGKTGDLKKRVQFCPLKCFHYSQYYAGQLYSPGRKQALNHESFKQAVLPAVVTGESPLCVLRHKTAYFCQWKRKCPSSGSADIRLWTHIFQTDVFCGVLSWTTSQGPLSGYVNPRSHSAICNRQESHCCLFHTDNSEDGAECVSDSHHFQNRSTMSRTWTWLVSTEPGRGCTIDAGRVFPSLHPGLFLSTWSLQGNSVWGRGTFGSLGSTNSGVSSGSTLLGRQ